MGLHPRRPSASRGATGARVQSRREPIHSSVPLLSPPSGLGSQPGEARHIRDDDLTDLLTPPPDDGFGFRQGRLLTYTPATGANTVLVGGGVLTNLPVVIEGGPANLQGDDTLGPGLGNVVVIMKYKSAWAILGRVLSPGNADVIDSATITQSGRLQNQSFIATATSTAVINLTTLVPNWANKLVMQSSFQVSIQGSGGSGVLDINIQTDGPTSTLAVAPSTGVSGTSLGNVSYAPGAISSITINDAVNVPVVPGSLVTVRGVVTATNSLNICTGWLVLTVNYQKI